MKTVLIWDLNISITPTGGPSGYLFNIKKYLLDSKKDDSIIFLSDVLRKPQDVTVKKERYLKSFLKRSDFILFLYSVYRILKVYNRPVYDLPIDINSFDVIHFHKIDDLYNARFFLSTYRGKVLLTTHSPESFATEYLYYCFGEKKKCLYSYFLSYLLKKEVSAYLLADNILFPSKYSTEPYEKQAMLKELFINIKHKFVFCPTCINDFSFPLINNDYFFENLHIPKKSLVVVYVGRHNEIKGYDYLKKVGEQVLSMFDDVYFVIAGKETPMEGLKHPRWIELGWIENSSEIIYHSDAFILPNKETYFDLIALEVLRAGTPFILTRTGGNKYLEDLSKSNEGALLFVEYGEVHEAVNLISLLRDKKMSGELNEIRVKNKKLFSDFFLMKNYLTTYNQIINDIKFEK